jgi:GDPmannose 4,6-dehydratase
MKKALICGISGQDGAYLAELLLKKGYEVTGTSRDAQMSSFSNLKKLNIYKDVRYDSMSIIDFRSVLQAIIKAKPDEIYNLAGQTSVGLSFEQPVETMESVSIGTLNLLEAIRFVNQPIKFYNASSGECYGDTGEEPATEKTLFKPKSPYAVAKCSAFWAVSSYREAYGLFACSGILFNHESPLRPERFVTRKIISAACRIAKGSKEKLSLGNIDIIRDWGWAPEYVQAMYQMLQQEKPQDYIIATGVSYSLRDFVRVTFETLGLDWEQHVDTDSSLIRPSEHMKAYAWPHKAQELLGWSAKFTMPEVIKEMINYEYNNPQTK